MLQLHHPTKHKNVDIHNPPQAKRRHTTPTKVSHSQQNKDNHTQHNPQLPNPIEASSTHNHQSSASSSTDMWNPHRTPSSTRAQDSHKSCPTTSGTTHHATQPRLPLRQPSDITTQQQLQQPLQLSTMITDQHDNTQRPLTTAAPNSTREDHIPTGTQDNHDMYCTKPFTGNYRGFSWNTEALMATSIRSQHRKGQQTCNLIAAHDFGTLSEVHGTPGKAEAYQLPPGTTAHWSHLSTSRAGIGLLVTNTFTKRFLPFQTGDWTDLEPGRIGRL